MFHVKVGSFIFDFEYAIRANLLFTRFAVLDVTVELLEDDHIIRRHEGGNYLMVVSGKTIQLSKGSATRIYTDRTPNELVNAIRNNASSVVVAADKFISFNTDRTIIWSRIDLKNGRFA